MERDSFTPVVRDRAAVWRRIAFLICGDWGSAEDVVQVALIRLYRHWHRLDEKGVNAYARTVISRLAINESVRCGRRGEVLGTVPDQPGVGVAVDDVLNVRAALGQVPPRQRAVLVLRFYCELSVAETAAALRISEGTVKSQCARGLVALRSMLAESAEHQPSDEKLGR